jgi:predicted nuclease of predicted toxin-antitoxin system
LAKLRIYTDENVDIRVAQGLRNRGIDALTAQENGMTGSTDLEHFNYAYQMQAVIFTHDRHFLEIAKKLIEAGKSHWGVIFVSMNKLSVGECIKKLAVYADMLTLDDMKNQIEFL